MKNKIYDKLFYIILPIVLISFLIIVIINSYILILTMDFISNGYIQIALIILIGLMWLFAEDISVKTSIITTVIVTIIIVGNLFSRYNVCDNKEVSNFPISIRLAAQHFLYDIKYLGARKRHNISYSFKNFCNKYKTIKKNIKQEATVDYRDDIVDDIIFDYTQNEIYYEYYDVGEKEYKRNRDFLTKKINTLIH